MKTVTAVQMRELDRRTVKSGTPGRVLMDRAGQGVANAVLERWLEARGPMLILAGKGNNGGDAFVVARHIAQRTDTPVIVLLACKKTEIKGDALYHFRKLPKSVRVESASHLSEFLHGKGRDVHPTIVDGLLGTGLQGDVRSPYREWIEQINACSQAYLVAIDIPSGLHADSGKPLGVAIRADLTVTLGLPKVGLLQPAATDWVGELEVVDIGIPPQFIEETRGEVEIVTQADIGPLFPRRRRSSHKGDFGHLFVVAGAEGYHGAAVLCAEAAARAGAGLVTLAVPRRIYSAVAPQCREIMVHPFEDTADGSFSPAAIDAIRPWFDRCNVVALGPGLSQNKKTKQFVVRLISDCPLPMVIDADGLNAVADRVEILKARKCSTVITPHPGEMARLIGKSSKQVQADRWGAAGAFAGKWGVTVVLKGAGTVIAEPGSPLWINMTGGPELAKGGSGDVLTGMLASFLAQGFAPADAAKAAVFLHGRAADLASQELGDRCVLARDVIAQFAAAIQSVASVP